MIKIFQNDNDVKHDFINFTTKSLVRSLQSSVDTEESQNSQINKKSKPSLNLDPKLLSILCEVDEKFVSNIHTFNNKADIHKYLLKLNQELDSQLAIKSDPENKKQEIIKALHNYNELKDSTQSVIGVISSLTGDSVTELHKNAFTLKMADSDDESSSSDDEDILRIEKKYVDKAIAMICGPSEEQEKFPFKFNLAKGPKAIRECHMPGLKALGLCSTAERSTVLLLNELHTCLSRHDFKNATKCLTFMLNKSAHMLPVTWKTCFLIIFNHPNSSKEIVEEFLHMCVGLRHADQMKVFLEELLTLPEDLEPISKGFRKTKNK